MIDFIGSADSMFRFFLGASGFSMIVGGLSFLLAPERKRSNLFLGIIFAAAGFLFCFSALDIMRRIPEALGSLLVIAAMLAIDQSLFEITLYIFSVDSRRRLTRRILLAGIAWSSLVWAIPLLDAFMRSRPAAQSLGSAVRLGPLHHVASIAIYIWPIALATIAVRIGTDYIRDLPSRTPGMSILLRGALCLLISLCVILVGIGLSWETLYRAGQAALVVLLLSSYLFAANRPDLFSRPRLEIQETHKKNIQLKMEEASIIEERLKKIIATSSELYNPRMNLRALSELIKVQPYRLTIYFKVVRNTSFSAWLNAIRIERFCRLYREQPETSILSIAMKVGYASKSVFNEQFRRIVGITPSEYGKSADSRREHGSTL